MVKATLPHELAEYLRAWAELLRAAQSVPLSVLDIIADDLDRAASGRGGGDMKALVKQREQLSDIAARRLEDIIRLTEERNRLQRENEALREALEGTLGLIGANRLLLGEFSGVRHVRAVEKKARRALTDSEEEV